MSVIADDKKQADFNGLLSIVDVATISPNKGLSNLDIEKKNDQVNEDTFKD